MKNLIRPIWVFLPLLILFTACDKDPDEWFNPDLPEEDPSAVVNRGYVYASNQSGNFEIWKFENDQVEQITQDESIDSWWPRYSRVDDQILFYQSTAGREVNDFANCKLVVMDADGSNSKTLIEQGAFGWGKHGLADWSNEGDRIVMGAVDPEIGTWQLYVTDADGSNPRRITTRDEANYLDPVFDIDDESVYCVAVPEGVENLDKNYEVLRVSIKDSLEERLTYNDHRDQHPDVSPDGTHIIFESLTDPDYLSIGKWTIRQLNLEDASESELLNDDQINLFPRYAVDGESVFYNQLSIETFAMNIAKLDLERDESSILEQGEHNSMNIDPY